MYQTKHQRIFVTLTSNVRQICTASPRERTPSQRSPKDHPARTHLKADSGWVLAVFSFSPWSSCFAIGYRYQKHVYLSIRMSSSLLKCLILMVASVVKKPSHDQGDSFSVDRPSVSGPSGCCCPSRNLRLWEYRSWPDLRYGLWGFFGFLTSLWGKLLPFSSKLGPDFEEYFVTLLCKGHLQSRAWVSGDWICAHMISLSGCKGLSLCDVFFD